MTPRQVRSVLTVLELGSVNRAAEALYLAPSSVSAQIRELSTELGISLFEPSGRGIIASSALRQLHSSLQNFINCAEEISQLAHSIAHEPSGTLKLFAPSSMCIYRLPKLVEAMQIHAPRVEIMLTHEPFAYRQALQSGEIDAAIIVSQVRPEACHYHPLYAEDVVFVCHPERWQTSSLTLNSLNEHPLITTEEGCTYRVAAEAHFRALGLTLKPRQAFTNVEVIRRCLLANMGTGLLPLCVVADDIAQGRLKIQAVEGTPYLFQSALVYPEGRALLPKLAAFIQVLELQSLAITGQANAETMLVAEQQRQPL
jgi:DNA-binding transcriptional LysR family regulator